MILCGIVVITTMVPKKGYTFLICKVNILPKKTPTKTNHNNVFLRIYMYFMTSITLKEKVIYFRYSILWTDQNGSD